MECQTVNFSDFKEVCRICMKNVETFLSISLFKIIKMITTCTSVQIEENDELPKQICANCYKQLENAFNLKQLCEESDAAFRQTLHAHYTKTLSTEIIIDSSNDKIKVEDDTTEDSDDDIDESQFYDIKKLEVDIIENSEDQISQNDQDHFFDVHFMDQEQEAHEISYNESSNMKYSGHLSESNLEKQIYVCELCNSQFDKVWYLGYHMRRSHDAIGQRCSKCAFVCYHPLHLMAHEQSHTVRIYKFECDICKKLFKVASELSRHQVQHSNDRPFQCTQCVHTFKCKKALNSHMKTKHTDKTSSLCPICGKKFFDYTLHAHLKRQHGNHFLTPLPTTNKKSHKCRVCKKSFSNKTGLKKHFKSHVIPK